jgi:hypothetical protein
MNSIQIMGLWTVFLVAVVLLLSGCDIKVNTESSDKPNVKINLDGVIKWHDDDDEVTCWYRNSLSCIPDSQLASKQVSANGKAD